MCKITVTNTGGVQTKNRAIIVVSRGQGQLTKTIEPYTPINAKEQNTKVMSGVSNFTLKVQMHYHKFVTLNFVIA